MPNGLWPHTCQFSQNDQLRPDATALAHGRNGCRGRPSVFLGASRNSHIDNFLDSDTLPAMLVLPCDGEEHRAPPGRCAGGCRRAVGGAAGWQCASNVVRFARRHPIIFRLVDSDGVIPAPPPVFVRSRPDRYRVQWLRFRGPQGGSHERPNEDGASPASAGPAIPISPPGRRSAPPQARGHQALRFCSIG